MIAKSLELFGPRSLVGYDIGCAFSRTIVRSSLGPNFERQGFRCCVNEFHGYSHNYQCQLLHHPNAIEGMGLEDLETMERIFSASNQLASVTRYASRYHRRSMIDMFFHQWDEDKYLNLATMLFNNYKQALHIISFDGPALDSTLASLKCTLDDLEQWSNDEHQYFTTLSKESEEDLHSVAYVELLLQLNELRCVIHSISL